MNEEDYLVEEEVRAGMFDCVCVSVSTDVSWLSQPGWHLEKSSFNSDKSTQSISHQLGHSSGK